MNSIAIGRSEKSDFIVPQQYDTVSNNHAIIEILDNHSFRLLDLDSSNGTEVYVSDDWTQVSDTIVDRDTQVRLGRDFIFNITKVLEKFSNENNFVASNDLKHSLLKNDKKNSNSRPYFDPKTGEIINE